MIPTEHETSVISSGISFMRAITEAYGSDQGLKMWDTIVNTLDPDLKGKIFFSMLTGRYSSQIILRSANPTADKIAAIKAIRIWDSRNLGLKEAKDLCDGVWMRNCMPLHVDPANREKVLEALRAAGVQAD